MKGLNAIFKEDYFRDNPHSTKERWRFQMTLAVLYFTLALTSELVTTSHQAETTQIRLVVSNEETLKSLASLDLFFIHR